MMTTFQSTNAVARRREFASRRRAGFTLVELLVVIAILAILSSMVLFALAGAEGSAKIIRTRTTIEKLHNLIMQKYESYRTRRVPITVPSTGARPTVFAMHRLNVLREIMRMEMPDRYTDIYDLPVNMTTPGGPTLISRPSANTSYLRALPTDLVTNFSKYSQFQSAECLYLVISRGLEDPEAMEQFSPAEIGDIDGDGMKEFLDAWGRPISFLRWAPGFNSTVQPKNASQPFYTEHDPFDSRGVHRPPNTTQTNDDAYHADLALAPPLKGVHPPLFPLIYSAGPDQFQDIQTDYPDTDTLYPFRYSKTRSTSFGGSYSNTTSPANNPYFPIYGVFIGTPADTNNDGEDNSQDNITNHDGATE